MIILLTEEEEVYEEDMEIGGEDDEEDEDDIEYEYDEGKCLKFDMIQSSHCHILISFNILWHAFTSYFFQNTTQKQRNWKRKNSKKMRSMQQIQMM